MVGPEQWKDTVLVFVSVVPFASLLFGYMLTILRLNYHPLYSRPRLLLHIIALCGIIYCFLQFFSLELPSVLIFLLLID